MRQKRLIVAEFAASCHPAEVMRAVGGSDFPLPLLAGGGREGVGFSLCCSKIKSEPLPNPFCARRKSFRGKQRRE